MTAPPRLTPYKIRDLEISPPLVLAPMSGVTTSAFRRLSKRLNPGCVGLVISEFISVEALTRKVRRSLEMMRFHEEERPYGIQIFGYDIQRMADGARMAQDAGADLVDINCGCPAPKVVKKGGGCELMRQPEHLQQIVRAVRKSVTIPLTLKMRSGWDTGSLNAVEIARMVEGEGVEALAVHGRSRVQLYRGSADWSVAQAVADAVRIPVLGSGDVVDSRSASERFLGGVAGLFIGRASMHNPFVFTEIVTGERVELRNDPARTLAILEQYLELLQEEFSPQAAIGKLKQLVSQMARHHRWRKCLLRARSFEDFTRYLGMIRESITSGTSLPAELLEERGAAPAPAYELDCESFSAEQP